MISILEKGLKNKGLRKKVVAVRVGKETSRQGEKCKLNRLKQQKQVIQTLNLQLNYRNQCIDVNIARK